jgi:hypothetical protein
MRLVCNAMTRTTMIVFRTLIIITDAKTTPNILAIQVALPFLHKVPNGHFVPTRRALSFREKNTAQVSFTRCHCRCIYFFELSNATWLYIPHIFFTFLDGNSLLVPSHAKKKNAHFGAKIHSIRIVASPSSNTRLCGTSCEKHMPPRILDS